MLLTCCTQYVSKFGQLSSGHRVEKRQFLLQSQRRAVKRMFKLLYNCAHFICQQGNAGNPSKQSSAVCELRTSRCTNWISKKQRNQRTNCQHPLDNQKKKKRGGGGFPKYTQFCFIDYEKSLTVWITETCGKFLRKWEYQATLSAS